ncbi:MAG: hypothetical protein HYT09_01510 [Candidatus Levybacteria bacterium]|nr:hypothetical protein [Candidatus Levybacteria bacterium]
MGEGDPTVLTQAEIDQGFRPDEEADLEIRERLRSGVMDPENDLANRREASGLSRRRGVLRGESYQELLDKGRILEVRDHLRQRDV